MQSSASTGAAGLGKRSGALPHYGGEELGWSVRRNACPLQRAPAKSGSWVNSWLRWSRWWRILSSPQELFEAVLARTARSSSESMRSIPQETVAASSCLAPDPPPHLERLHIPHTCLSRCFRPLAAQAWAN